MFRLAAYYCISPQFAICAIAVQDSGARFVSGLCAHDPFAVRADPSGAVAEAPFVFFEALGADLKPAWAVPAEGLMLFTTAADEFTEAASAIAHFALIFHDLVLFQAIVYRVHRLRLYQPQQFREPRMCEHLVWHRPVVRTGPARFS